MDLAEKLREYSAIGVTLVWLIDPYARRVFVYRAVTEVPELTDADRLSGDEVLPGFDIPIAALFAPTPSFPLISTSC